MPFRWAQALGLSVSLLLLGGCSLRYDPGDFEGPRKVDGGSECCVLSGEGDCDCNDCDAKCKHAPCCDDRPQGDEPQSCPDDCDDDED